MILRIFDNTDVGGNNNSTLIHKVGFKKDKENTITICFIFSFSLFELLRNRLPAKA
jgi:hypothetical protein